MTGAGPVAIDSSCCSDAMSTSTNAPNKDDPRRTRSHPKENQAGPSAMNAHGSSENAALTPSCPFVSFVDDFFFVDHHPRRSMAGFGLRKAHRYVVRGRVLRSASRP